MAKLKGELGLLLTVMLWATSFVASGIALGYMSSFQLLLFRFTVATVVMTVVVLIKRPKLERTAVVSGAALGVMLFLGFALQTYGLSLSTPAKNAFLTGAYVIVVPIISFAVYRRRISRRYAFAATATMIGAGFLSLETDFSINIGDVLTLVSAIFYALHIFYVAEFSAKRDILLMTAVQFATCAVLALAATLVTGTFDLSVLDARTTPYVLYLGTVCTALCFFLQMYFQKLLTETQATIIFSMEGPFSAIFSVALALEPFTLRLLAGSALMFGAAVYFQRGERKTNAADSCS